MSLEILFKDEDGKIYRFDGASEGSSVIYLERLDENLNPTDNYDSFLTEIVLDSLTEMTNYFVADLAGKFSLFELLIYLRSMRRFQKEEYRDCTRSPELKNMESKVDKSSSQMLAYLGLTEHEAIA